ncbi:MAG: LysR family transcriptional regulator [Burkholderiaceae bacterium]|jgi:DNA-binding transcriptional LysR family regulator|nr:LysR family transcriptional regulator [Burkholderiaceae bacterium]MDP4800507.1 LysR family transcriptional regulator [Burkholderiaceae bacterium]
MDHLQALQAYVRVVDLGSFSKAAAEVGLGQPAITKAIAQLEARLGSRLLHRTTRGVSVTEVGALYYERGREILHQVEEAQNQVAAMRHELHGAIRISTSVAFGRRVLAPLVIQFLKQHPGLQIDLSFEDRYINLLEQGIDVAIRMGRLADSSLGSRYLGLNPWAVVASPSYLQSRGTPLVPTALQQHSALIYSTVQGDARWQFTGPKGEEQAVTVQGPLRSNNLAALLMAAREDMGIAALPRYVAHGSIRAGLVREILADWRMPSQEVHAVYPSPRLLPTKVGLLLSWLQSQFQDTWWTRP